MPDFPVDGRLSPLADPRAVTENATPTTQWIGLTGRFWKMWTAGVSAPGLDGLPERHCLLAQHLPDRRDLLPNFIGAASPPPP
jgi:hypothetical protein